MFKCPFLPIMPKLPVVKPRKFISVLKKKGFVEVRSDGSHLRYHDESGHKVTVPFHNQPFAKGTLLSMLRQAGMTKDELIDLL